LRAESSFYIRVDIILTIKSFSRPKLMETCKKQFEIAKKQIEDYNKKYDKYEEDSKSYDNYKSLEQQRKTCTGVYKEHCGNVERYLREHYKVWGNCSPDRDVWDVQHNDWCVNDTGSTDYRHQTKRWGGGCSVGFNKGVCVYTDEAIERKKNELLDEEQPIHKLGDGRNWGASSRPTPPIPGDINVTCCAQDFGDISASGNARINFDEIANNCSQTINKETSVNSTKNGSMAITGNTNTETNTNTNTNTDNQKIIIGIIVSLGITSLCVIILLLFVFL
jgi:hypothetical protein